MSTRKRLSLRAIARLKRENHDLRAELGAIKRGYASTRVARLTLMTEATAQIKTAHVLGYTTVVRDHHDGSFGVYALKLREDA